MLLDRQYKLWLQAETVETNESDFSSARNWSHGEGNESPQPNTLGAVNGGAKQGVVDPEGKRLRGALNGRE